MFRGWIRVVMFDLANVNVVSFNVNGIRSENKRRAIFNYLKYFKSHIILLQETHSVPDDEVIWSNEWGAKIHFCHGNNMSKGVAIMYARNFPVEILEIRYDVGGRYLISDIVIGSLKFTLVNVYGPNEDDPSFYIRLFEVIELRDNTSLMLVGDFNTSLCPVKDLYNNKGSNHVHKRLVLQEYIEDKNLVDIWRLQHPEDRVYSWRKPGVNDLVMSRLDFFLVSQDLVLRVNSSDIRTRYNSDHSRITLNINCSIAERGPGYWKFNNLYLQDKQFLELMNNEILQFLYSVKNKDESELDTQWERIKTIMIETAKTFSRKKAKERNQLIEKLEMRILTLDKKLLETHDSQKIEKYKRDIQKTEQFLLNEHDKRVQAAKFRSKAQYFLEGERNSKYFFNLERTRGNAKIISQLVREDGSIIKDPCKILAEEKIFYEKLYGGSAQNKWDFTNTTDIKLSEQDRELLDQELSDSEISSSLMGMANGKSPGLDGLTTEFYKVFWIHLKNIYCRVVRFVLDRGLIHETARMGLITLLAKKDQDLRYLKNWHPLTLLNVDYKIISRAIAERLKSQADFLISRDQTGFLKGRNIAESLRTILDVVQIANHRSLDMILVSMDWDKCFD